MKITNKILKISWIVLLLTLMVGCKADEIPCKAVVQEEYELVN
jgi:hypothetical protein